MTRLASAQKYFGSNNSARATCKHLSMTESSEFGITSVCKLPTLRKIHSKLMEFGCKICMCSKTLKSVHSGNCMDGWGIMDNAATRTDTEEEIKL